MSSSYSTNVMWKWLERVLAQVIQLIVQIVLARIVTIEEFGVVSIVVIISTFATVFVQNGFCLALVQKKDSDELDFASVFSFNLVLSLLLYLVLFFVSPAIASFYDVPSLSQVLRIYLLILPINAFGAIQNALIQKRLLYKETFFCSAVVTIISGAIGVYLAINGFGVWALVSQQLGFQVLYSVFLLFILKWKPCIKLSVQRLKPMIPFGFSMLFTSLVAQLNERVYSIVIGKAFDESTLALFIKGHQFPNLATSSLNTSNANVLFAVISNTTEDKEAIKKVIKESIQKSLYFALPMLCGIFLIAHEMVIILLTEKWELCIPFVRTECVFSFILLITTIFNQSIKAYGKGRLCVILELVKLLLTFVAFFLFYKRGLIFACYAKIIVALIMFFVSFVFAKLYFCFGVMDLIESSWKIVISIIPIVIATYLIKIAFANSHLIVMTIIEVGISAVFYVVSTFLLRVNETRVIVDKIRQVMKG